MNIFTTNNVNQIIEMYKNNISIDDIIAYFCVEEKDVRKILKEYQIDRKYNNFSDELYKRIEYLYSNGLTCLKISEMLLITETSVTRILKKRNIRIRTSSEANRRYSLNEHYFDEVDTPNKAYLLGILYSDGCNHIKHHSITLSLQEEDRDVVEFMKSELQYEGPIRINKLSNRNKKYKDQCILCINSVYLSNRLEQLGIVNAKSLVITFPEWLNEEFYPYFIAGYFDGDGCISYDKKRQKCSTKTAGTREFCDKLSEILFCIGCKHHLIHPKQCANSNTFVLQTSGNKSSLLFLDYMYNNDCFHMNRKYQKYLYFKEKYLGKNNTQVA